MVKVKRNWNKSNVVFKE